MPVSAAQQLADAAQAQATTAVPIAVGAVVAIGALAFGIKGLFVAWRAGSKALGKTGS